MAIPCDGTYEAKLAWISDGEPTILEPWLRHCCHCTATRPTLCEATCSDLRNRVVLKHWTPSKLLFLSFRWFNWITDCEKLRCFPIALRYRTWMTQYFPIMKWQTLLNLKSATYGQFNRSLTGAVVMSKQQHKMFLWALNGDSVHLWWNDLRVWSQNRNVNWRSSFSIICLSSFRHSLRVRYAGN